MGERPPSLEERIEEMGRQLELLARRVETLEGHTVDRPPEEAATPLPAAIAAPAPPEEYPLGEPADISEEVIGWASRASLLQRVATLCFLLVIALILRTITDNGLIGTLVGSAIGMGYATILMLAGWYQYRRGSPLAPVFAACGAVLMALIVVETHTRFLSLPLVPAYLTLMATGIGMAAISYQFTVFLPVSVGTLGMCLAGAAIDYPNPFFPYLAMVLFTANLLGFYAAGIRRCSWLRWIVLVVTLVMLQLWGTRVGLSLAGRLPSTSGLAIPTFLPLLAVFALMYPAVALMGIVRSGAARVTRFDFSLPTVNAFWAYLLARYAVRALEGSITLLGGAGVALAVAHGAAGLWLVKGRRVQGAHGTNSFLFAASVLLALALPDAVGSPLVALPLLAASAVGLAFLSERWESGGVRLTSYLLQLYATGVLAVTCVTSKPGDVPVAAAAVALLLGAASLAHYRWCRTHEPPVESQVFGRLDRNDLGAAVLLMGSLVSGFFMLRILDFQLLPALGGDPVTVFRCSQSIIINLAAIGLIITASVLRHRELRNVAILVLLVGGVKVFLYDFIGTKGVPLVLSVLSFGLAAALQSIILGRWQAAAKRESPDG
ncbi:MAG TPA: hypothetical protein VI389_06215 [Geobacteraceae bacterium]